MKLDTSVMKKRKMMTHRRICLRISTITTTTLEVRIRCIYIDHQRCCQINQRIMLKIQIKWRKLRNKNMWNSTPQCKAGTVRKMKRQERTCKNSALKSIWRSQPKRHLLSNQLISEIRERVCRIPNNLKCVRAKVKLINKAKKVASQKWRHWIWNISPDKSINKSSIIPMLKSCRRNSRKLLMRKVMHQRSNLQRNESDEYKR